MFARADREGGPWAECSNNILFILANVFRCFSPVHNWHVLSDMYLNNFNLKQRK